MDEFVDQQDNLEINSFFSDEEANTDNEIDLPGDFFSDFEQNEDRDVKKINANIASLPEKQKSNQSSHLKANAFWSDLMLSKALIKALIDMGHDTPTFIQKEVIPSALQGKDILGTAETGSGKTSAFLLPILERLLRSPLIKLRIQNQNNAKAQMGTSATKALILLPTRELALQCYNALQSLTIYTPITSTFVAGGMSLKSQESEVRLQPDIIVATPGRILDLLMNSQNIHLELLEVIVFDEADRLMELGFKEDCQEIINRCNHDRQTMLFSATLTNETSQLASFTLNHPINVTVNTSHKVTRTLEQEFVKVEEDIYKEAALLHLCLKSIDNNAIIFFQTKKSAHRIAIILKLMEIEHAELHGNLSQKQRLDSLERFRNGTTRLLLATELASRGLDIEGVETVINFDIPSDTARYVHRVGRTARMGNKGKAITLFTPSQHNIVKKMAKEVSNIEKNSNSTFYKRKIPTNSLKELNEKIRKFEKSIKQHLQNEHQEREIRLAEMEIKKAENYERYADDIKARPARKWHMTEKQKVEVRKNSKTKNKHDKEKDTFKNITSSNKDQTQTNNKKKMDTKVVKFDNKYSKGLKHRSGNSHVKNAATKKTNSSPNQNHNNLKKVQKTVKRNKIKNNSFKTKKRFKRR